MVSSRKPLSAIPHSDGLAIIYMITEDWWRLMSSFRRDEHARGRCGSFSSLSSRSFILMLYFSPDSEGYRIIGVSCHVHDEMDGRSVFTACKAFPDVLRGRHMKEGDLSSWKDKDPRLMPRDAMWRSPKRRQRGSLRPESGLWSVIHHALSSLRRIKYREL